MKRPGKIESAFLDNRAQGRKSLAAFINTGDPDLETSKNIIRVLERSGADVVELGVPFPHSFTDGEVILRSHERALKKGIRLEHALETVESLRSYSKIPILLMAEFGHSVRPYGLKTFLSLCNGAGVDGVLVHCLPPYLLQEYCELAADYSLDTIFSLYPKTPIKTREGIYRIAKGFIYLVTYYGKTGGGKLISETTLSYLSKVRQETSLPLAAGFGVKTPADLEMIYRTGIDGGIIGSAFVSLIEKNINDRDAMLNDIGTFCDSLLHHNYP